MFCAAQHKGLSVSEKERYRKQHAGKKTVANRVARRK